MPSKTKSSTSKQADSGLFEEIRESRRKATETYLDIAEKAAGRLAELQERAGGMSPVEWVGEVARAQAEATRRLAGVYVSTTRKVIA
jgi:hypothetical protein